MRKLAIGFATLLLLGSVGLAQDDMALLNFVVIRDYNGKPIRTPSLVMHPVEKNGKQSKGGLQLKTDGEGRASFDGVPYGKLRVQVLITGFQNFGQDYEISQPQTEITIRLKRPADQYSIYDDKNQGPQQGKPQETQQDKKA